MNDYECNGPFEFGLGRFKVCCHGWNEPHFLSEKEVNYTQKLINAGVINTVSGQRVEKVEYYPLPQEAEVR